MISTNWKAGAATAVVLALSVAVLACQNGSAPPPDQSTWTNPIDEAVYVRVPAGAYSPAGDSPYGVADMAGNVWEWTSSLQEPYPYTPTDGREDLKADGGRGLRGGAFFDDESRVRCAARFALSPRSLGDALYGFRVCASPQSTR